MRICILKATKRIIEMQGSATEGTLLQNAINAGYSADEVEEREVDEAGYEAAKAADPVEIAAKQAAIDKAAAVTDAKASISTIETAVDKATDLDTLKKVVLDLVKAVKVLTA